MPIFTDTTKNVGDFRVSSQGSKAVKEVQIDATNAAADVLADSINIDCMDLIELDDSDLSILSTLIGHDKLSLKDICEKSYFSKNTALSKLKHLSNKFVNMYTDSNGKYWFTLSDNLTVQDIELAIEYCKKNNTNMKKFYPYKLDLNRIIEEYETHPSQAIKRFHEKIMSLPSKAIDIIKLTVKRKNKITCPIIRELTGYDPTTIHKYLKELMSCDLFGRQESRSPKHNKKEFTYFLKMNPEIVKQALNYTKQGEKNNTINLNEDISHTYNNVTYNQSLPLKTMDSNLPMASNGNGYSHKEPMIIEQKSVVPVMIIEKIREYNKIQQEIRLLQNKGRFIEEEMKALGVKSLNNLLNDLKNINY